MNLILLTSSRNWAPPRISAKLSILKTKETFFFFCKLFYIFSAGWTDSNHTLTSLHPNKSTVKSIAVMFAISLLILISDSFSYISKILLIFLLSFICSVKDWGIQTCLFDSLLAYSLFCWQGKFFFFFFWNFNMMLSLPFL